MSSAGIIAHRLHLSSPPEATLVLWTMGDGVVQKSVPGEYPFPIQPMSTANYESGFSSTQRGGLQVHRNSGRVFVPSLTAVWVYESGASGDPADSPVFDVAFSQNMLIISSAQTAVDQDTGTFTACGGQNDNALLIFSDNSTQTISFGANTSPHMVKAMGSGKFAYYCLDDGLVRVYGPSNNYATPLVESTTPLFSCLDCDIDLSGQRLFLSCEDTDSAWAVDLVTGLETEIDTGNRHGYKIKYDASLDRLVMDNVGEDGKVYVIDPDTGIVLTIDYATAFNTSDGYDMDPGSFRDMGVLDGMVTLIAEFTFEGGPPFYAALMLDIATGDLLDAFEFQSQTYSVAVNDREGEFYIGAVSSYEVAVFKVGGPYRQYLSITQWEDPDTRFVTWL